MLSERRERALALVRAYVPSAYGDAKFAEMLNGAWAPGYGTTCGYLTSWLLWRLGCKDGRVVNRTTSEGLAYAPGQNIAKIVNGGKALGVWREKGAPQPGDIYAVWTEAPLPSPALGGALDYKNHVGVVVEASADVWRTADAGQGTGAAQRAEYRERRVVSADPWRLAFDAPRRAGWIDLDALELGAPPVDDDGGAGALGVAMGALLALGALGAWWIA